MSGRFEQVIRLTMAQVKPPEVQKLHAALARKGLAEHMARLPAGARPQVRTIVDGRIGASEDSVQPYGLIRYEFTQLGEVAQAALAAVLERVPRKSGTYHKSWFVMVDGKPVAPDAIPLAADEVIIVSDEPYSRRLLVGRRKDGRPFVLTNLPPGFMELAKEAVMGRFGNQVQVNVRFIALAGAYTLRGSYKAPGQRKSYKGKRAGDEITYPALVIRRRG